MNNKTKATPDLKFPEVKDAPKPYLPDLSLDEAASWIKNVTSWLPNSIPTPQERLRTKIDVPFELKE